MTDSYTDKILHSINRNSLTKLNKEFPNQQLVLEEKIVHKLERLAYYCDEKVLINKLIQGNNIQIHLQIIKIKLSELNSLINSFNARYKFQSCESEELMREINISLRKITELLDLLCKIHKKIFKDKIINMYHIRECLESIGSYALISNA